MNFDRFITSFFFSLELAIDTKLKFQVQIICQHLNWLYQLWDCPHVVQKWCYTFNMVHSLAERNWFIWNAFNWIYLDDTNDLFNKKCLDWFNYSHSVAFFSTLVSSHLSGAIEYKLYNNICNKTYTIVILTHLLFV